MGRRTVGTQDFRCRWHNLSIFLVVYMLFQNLDFTTAKIVLPVLRSFSQLEGSGLHEGADGMTREHAQELKDHDFQRSQRHQRKLTAVADFPLDGNEYYIGLYYTELGLGSPSQKYYVQVDTGSDLLWVNCKPCPKCPRDSDLKIPLNLYDPQETTTGRNVSCLSADCKTLATISASSCIDKSCYYWFAYGDRSTTMGYLVEDVLTFSTVVGNNTVQNATADIVFGCGFNQTGPSLTSSDRAVDGILGFGRQVLSVISQLADGDLTTNEFAHCLQGDTGHGGLFVVGDVEQPGLVYTPMLPNEYHYNVNLQRISVGDTMLSIDSSAFSSDSDGNGGTIFDSGTTLALFVDKAFDAFYNQLVAVVTVPYVTIEDTICFEYSSRNITGVFPPVTLYFEDGAEMQLKPENYLYRQQVITSSQWCLAWSPSSSSRLDITILGDIILKNKLVVYDIDNERIGWMDFDCQSALKVSSGSGNQERKRKTSDGNKARSHTWKSWSYRVVFMLFSSLAADCVFRTRHQKPGLADLCVKRRAVPRVLTPYCAETDDLFLKCQLCTGSRLLLLVPACTSYKYLLDGTSTINKNRDCTALLISTPAGFRKEDESFLDET